MLSRRASCPGTDFQRIRLYARGSLGVLGGLSAISAVKGF